MKARWFLAATLFAALITNICAVSMGRNGNSSNVDFIIWLISLVVLVFSAMEMMWISIRHEIAADLYKRKLNELRELKK